MNKSSGKGLGYIAITIVAIIYGVSYMARNVITDTGAMQPPVITFFQLAIMAVLFLVINLIGRKSMKIAPKHIPMLILSGVFGTFIFHTLTNLSVSRVGAGIPSLMYGFAAAFSLIISVIFFRKKTNVLCWVSVIVGVVGLYIIMGITPASFADTDMLGYLFSIGCVLAWVIYCFLADKVSDEYDKTVVLFWNAVVGLVASCPFLIAYPIKGEVFSANVSSIVVCLVILGVFNATFAYFLNLYAVKKIGVNMANIFLNFMPVATLAAVFFVYGTPPKAHEVIGGVIVIASVFLLGWAESLLNKKQAKAAETAP